MVRVGVWIHQHPPTSLPVPSCGGPALGWRSLLLSGGMGGQGLFPCRAAQQPWRPLTCRLGPLPLGL